MATSAKRPRITGMPNGRPKIDITKEQLLSLYLDCGNWDKVAETIGVSRATVFKRLKEYNLKKEYGFYNLKQECRF